MSAARAITGTEAETLDRRLRVMVEGLHGTSSAHLKHLLGRRSSYADMYPPLVFDEAAFTLAGRKAA